MASGVQRAFFLLVDVSGYTSFIAENELEHAQEVMGNLLNLLVGELTPIATLVVTCPPVSSASYVSPTVAAD